MQHYEEYYKKILSVVLGITVLTVCVVLRTRTYPAPEADYQTYIKILVWMIGAILCLPTYRAVLNQILRIDNVFFTLFIALCFISAFYAPLFYFSFASVLTVICTFIVCATCCQKLEDKIIFRQVFFSLSLVCILSIVIYYILPDFGRFKEWHGGEQIIGPRMTGVTGTANALGFISAFSILLGIHALKQKHITGLFNICLLSTNFFALLMSNSRTSLAALIIALALYALISYPTYFRIITYATVSALGVILVLVIDPETLMESLSRSGSADEITSGTGRTSIWSVAIYLIFEKPFLGYGFASTLQIFDEQVARVGFKVASAHNMILQILLSVGILGALLFFIALLIKTYTAAKNKNAFIICGILFIMIIGLTEATAIQGTANASTFALLLLFSLRYKQN